MKKAKFFLEINKNYKFLFIPQFIKRKLMWKDKFGIPNCEREPYFLFEWLWISIYGVWGECDYWEQWLWTYKYNDGDVLKAKNTWMWHDIDGKISTWIDY